MDEGDCVDDKDDEENRDDDDDAFGLCGAAPSIVPQMAAISGFSYIMMMIMMPILIWPTFMTFDYVI